MSTENSSANTKKYWMIFFISTIFCIALLIIIPEWFWVALPMVFTSLVYALDVV